MDSITKLKLPDRVEVMGAPVDPWTMEQTVEATDALIKNGCFAHLIGVNADKLLQMRDDPEMDACVHRCEIVNADGASMVMAAKKLDVDLPGRVAGIDLMWELCRLAEREGHRVMAQWNREQKVDDDSRVTRIGRLIRKTSLDEVP